MQKRIKGIIYCYEFPNGNTLKIVKKFESPKLAIETTKIHHIQSCLNGSRKTAGGFIWIYEDKHKNKNYD